MDQPVIRVGTGIIMLNNAGQFLMGRRKNTHGGGTWGVPGGTVEYGETFEQCARREALEETGLDITDFETIAVNEHFFPGGKHFVAIFCICRIKNDALPRVMEPDKHEEWMFFDRWGQFPDPMFVDYNTQVKAELVVDYCKRHGLGTCS